MKARNQQTGTNIRRSVNEPVIEEVYKFIYFGNEINS
jgi:hypothetical protein